MFILGFTYSNGNTASVAPTVSVIQDIEHESRNV